MSGAVQPKPRMGVDASERQYLTTLSLDDIKQAVHGYGVALGILSLIKDACDKAAAQDAAINPASLAAFIDDNAPQLNVITAKRVDV